MGQHPVSRRNFLAGASVVAATAALVPSGRASAAPAPGAAPSDAADGVDLHWLDGQPAATTGASWGVPWAKGQLPRESTFALQRRRRQRGAGAVVAARRTGRTAR